MAINQNHLFEELNGIKCAIVEKNVPKERAEFLKNILEYNQFTVIIVAGPPPKAAPAPAPTVAATPTEDPNAMPPPAVPTPAAPETFTVGVTDVMFNPINAIFGRLLKTPRGNVVTLAYWQGKEGEARDDVPYFSK
jgi:hypothetical protein